MEQEPRPYSAEDIRHKVNGAGVRNVTRPVVENQIARAVYEMRVDPFGEGEDVGGNIDVDHRADKKPETQEETLQKGDGSKKPRQKMIVPY